MYIKQTMSKTIQTTNPFHVSVQQEANQTDRNQTQLNMPHIDVLAAMWYYLGNLPFNVFESAIGKKFVHALHPAYKDLLCKPTSHLGCAVLGVLERVESKLKVSFKGIWGA